MTHQGSSCRPFVPGTHSNPLEGKENVIIMWPYWVPYRSLYLGRRCQRLRYNFFGVYERLFERNKPWWARLDLWQARIKRVRRALLLHLHARPDLDT